MQHTHINYMHVQEVKKILCVFRYLCTYLPTYDTLNIDTSNSICHNTCTCLAAAFELVPMSFQTCILQFFPKVLLLIFVRIYIRFTSKSIF